jgi:lysophospholipase L1-like esterase
LRNFTSGGNNYNWLGSHLPSLLTPNFITIVFGENLVFSQSTFQSNVLNLTIFLPIFSSYSFWLLPNSSRHSHCLNTLTIAFAALAPLIATAGKPIPGKIPSPAKSKFPIDVLPSAR